MPTCLHDVARPCSLTLLEAGLPICGRRRGRGRKPALPILPISTTSPSPRPISQADIVSGSGVGITRDIVNRQSGIACGVHLKLVRNSRATPRIAALSFRCAGLRTRSRSCIVPRMTKRRLRIPGEIAVGGAGRGRLQRVQSVACNLVLLGAALLALLATSASYAEEVSSDASARATALFAEGAKLLDEGRTAEACPKFEAAVSLTRRSALGGMMALAECYVESGRVASAWGLYNEVLAKATAAAQSERARDAEAKAAALAPRVPRLLLEIPAELARLSTATVWINGLEQPRAGLASGIPVDPGVVEIEVRVPGSPTGQKTLEVTQVDREVRITLPMPTASADPQPPNAPSEHLNSTSSFWSTGRFVGLGVGSVGVAVVIAGFSVSGAAASDYDAGLAAGNCTGTPLICDDIGPIEEARTLGDIATGLLVSGLGVSVTGILVFALSGGEEFGSPPAALHAYPNGVRLDVPVW